MYVALKHLIHLVDVHSNLPSLFLVNFSESVHHKPSSRLHATFECPIDSSELVHSDSSFK